MWKRVTCLITGILFAISLVFASYLYLVLGIFSSFKKANIIATSIYILPIFALISLIGACLIFKKVMATRVMISLSLAVFLFYTIYTFALGLFSLKFLLIVILTIILAVASIVLTFFIKNKEKVEVAPNVEALTIEKMSLEDGEETSTKD